MLMNMRILRGTVIGGIVYFFLGWLVYGYLLMDVYANHMNQCAQRAEADMIWWAMIAANLLFALLLTLILNWSDAKNIKDGIKTSALFGIIMAAAIDLSFYSYTTTFNSFSVVLIDIIITAVMAGVIGAVIVLTWGKKE